MDVSMLISFRTTRIRSLIVKTCVSKKKNGVSQHIRIFNYQIVLCIRFYRDCIVSERRLEIFERHSLRRNNWRLNGNGALYFHRNVSFPLNELFKRSQNIPIVIFE